MFWGAILWTQAFHRLPDEDKATLVEEMARTGIPSQSYTTAVYSEGGPAFLVRTLSSKAAHLALSDCALNPLTNSQIAAW